MIALSSNCLLFRTKTGESLPLTPEMISIEVLKEAEAGFDEEFVQHASDAVFHYFRHELGRDSVTVAEFAAALEKVLKSFAKPEATPPPAPQVAVAETHLDQLAAESGAGCELLFFPALRTQLRQHLSARPRVVRFRGLRPCVKRMTGARRWTTRCRILEERIVAFLQECITAEPKKADFALVVD